MLSTALANRLGFWLLGLTNNIAYVIMLSAAFDLLHKGDHQPKDNTENQTNTNGSFCNPLSTSTILLADTMPSLSIKLIYPFLLVDLPIALKVVATVAFSAGSFIITGLSSYTVLIFTGVISASLASGLGETIYLSSTSKYGQGALSAWSSGTGAAGLLGALCYAIMTMLTMSTKAIMFTMLTMPITMAVTYFFIIREEKPKRDETSDERLNVISPNSAPKTYSSTEDNQPNDSSLQQRAIPNQQAVLTTSEKLNLLPTLLKYFIPLSLVYYGEYFINQGLFELVYFPEVTWLGQQAQYRWYQVAYQFGVLLSRSSLDFVRLKRIWLMALLQFVNLAIFLAHTTNLIHLPGFYFTLALIVYEGLLGGFAYVNTFDRVTKEVRPEVAQFCISSVVIADSIGIVTAGFSSIPVHDAICRSLYQS